MIRNFLRAGLVCLGFFGLTTPPLAWGNVEAIGSAEVAPTVRQMATGFTAATGIRASYTNALEDVSTSELFVGIYDLAVVAYPSPDYRLQQMGLFQFPLFTFGVTVVTNVPGIPADTLRLNGEVLAEIYSGRITRWNDPKIVHINPELRLPPLLIAPIAQSDGSIATLNFTRYLAAGSTAWREQIGIGSGLIWPLGEGEKDSRSAAQRVMDTPGAVGFQPAMNLAAFNLSTAQLQNGQGDFVSFSHANVGGKLVWPIMSVVYGQMKLVPEDISDAIETRQFLTWALKNPTAIAFQPGLHPVAYEVVAPALNSMITKKTYDGRAAKKGNGS